MRAALVAYFEQADTAPARSAHALGADLFGRHRGAPNLAQQRKAALAEVWEEKHARRLP